MTTATVRSHDQTHDTDSIDDSDCDSDDYDNSDKSKSVQKLKVKWYRSIVDGNLDMNIEAASRLTTDMTVLQRTMTPNMTRTIKSIISALSATLHVAQVHPHAQLRLIAPPKSPARPIAIDLRPNVDGIVASLRLLSRL